MGPGERGMVNLTGEEISRIKEAVRRHVAAGGELSPPDDWAPSGDGMSDQPTARGRYERKRKEAVQDAVTRTIAVYRQNGSMKTTAEILGVTRQTVGARLRAAGVDTIAGVKG